MIESVQYKPIGIIHTPFKEPKGTPIQPTAVPGVKGTVEVFSGYIEGLQDLDEFSHLYLIYHLHLVKKSVMRVRPFLDNKLHGIFATRGPSRPNPIGLSVVRMLRMDVNTLYIQDVDMIDGTPLLDIKPFVPEFDHREAVKTGWLASAVQNQVGRRDDGRFLRNQ